MKLFQYVTKAGSVSAGIVLNAKHYDLAQLLGSDKAIDMEAILSDTELQARIAGLAEASEPMNEAQLQFAVPLSNPEKILCIGLNYWAHQEETNLRNQASFPPMFCKFKNSLAAHREAIILPVNANRFDYEAELVIVIGKTAKAVSEAEAMEYIFGFTVGNDFSARDLQMATSQWLPGKACDGFAPVGPYLVTRDEIDCNHLQLKTRVNGKTCQDGNTQDMIFNCAQIVSTISRNITLVPGDMIFTGTPSGVILGKPEDQRVWLKAGDVVEIEIEGIGTLTNPLIAGK